MSIINLNDNIQRFKLSNGNEIELDTADINVVKRLQTVMSGLSELSEIASAAQPTSQDETLATLEHMHQKMCDKIDYVFGEGVASACCCNKSMMDFDEGGFRYEKIIAALSAVYGEGLEKAAKALRKRSAQAAAKYRNV